MLSRPKNRLVDYSVVPAEILLSGSVHEFGLSFSSGSHPRSCRNCSTHSPAVDGGSRSVKNWENLFPSRLWLKSKFIDVHYPGGQNWVTASTAYAARFISDIQTSHTQPCSRSSAEEYGLELIAEDWFRKWKPISHVLGARGRYRRFLEPQAEKWVWPDLLGQPSGALYKALSALALERIDLTRLKVVP